MRKLKKKHDPNYTHSRWRKRKPEAMRGPLPAETVQLIRELRADGLTYKKISERTGASEPVISHIVNGRMYLWVE